MKPMLFIFRGPPNTGKTTLGGSGCFSGTPLVTGLVMLAVLAVGHSPKLIAAYGGRDKARVDYFVPVSATEQGQDGSNYTPDSERDKIVNASVVLVFGVAFVSIVATVLLFCNRPLGCFFTIVVGVIATSATILHIIFS